MVNIFKGYMKSHGKIPLGSVKTETYLTEPPTDHDYVGVLKEDIVQLDFDDESSAKKAMEIVNHYKCKCNILETSRGIHLYFKSEPLIKSQHVGVYNAVGIKCDIGLGSKSRVVPLRTTKEVDVERIIGGKATIVKSKKVHEREWLQTWEELDVIPPYFRPISKTNPEFDTSESRNNDLFTYILKLQQHGFNRDESRKTLKVVNKFMFKEPLTDRELDVITREEAFQEEFFFGERGQFLHNRFGDYLLANANIVLLDGLPHIYTSDSVYSADRSEFEKVMLNKIPSLKEAQRKEVLSYLSLKCTRVVESGNPKYLAFADGLLNIQTMEEEPFSPNHVVTNKIDYSYNPNAYHELLDKTLTKIANNDPNVRSLIEEMIGYTLYRKNVMQSCFILTGEGSNGKSTLLNLIKKLLGRRNYCSLELADLEDTYKPAEMHGKLANMGDDISSKYMESSSIFKKVVTGESFVAQKKYGQPFEMSCYATQIFSANELPHVKDKSDGFSRRICIIPFSAKFSRTDDDFDPFIEDKLGSTESLEYLLKLAVDGLNRILATKNFTKTETGEREKEEYLMSNDNLREYISEGHKIEDESLNDVYLAYTVWCSRVGTMALKRENFSTTIRKRLGLKLVPKYVNGKTIRVFEK